MRTQHKLTFQLGYDFDSHPTTSILLFEEHAARLASSISGGCTTSIKKGWWCPEGTQRRRRFDPLSAQSERTFEIELTCEDHKLDQAYLDMQNGLASLAAEFMIETDWVHVSEVEIKGRHFSIASLNATLAAE